MKRPKRLPAGPNPAARGQQPDPAAAPPQAEGDPARSGGLWSDLMGRMAIRGIQLLVLGLVAAAIVIGLQQVTTIVIPVLIATILACALWPLVARLRRHLSDLLSAWTVFLGSLVVLAAIAAGVVLSIISQWDELVRQAQRGLEQLGRTAQQLMNALPVGIDQQRIDSLTQAVGKFATSAQFGSGALHTLGTAGELATGAVLLLVVLFFFLKDGDRIWAFILSWAPRRYRSKWIASGFQAQSTFGGYIRGTAIIASVDAVGITAVLLILRLPLALPLGVVVFVGSFIPVVGATVAGALAVLVALVASGPTSALIVLAAVIGVNQLEGHFLQPVVMARTLRLHPLVVLMSLAVGTALGGIIGAVLAVPLTAVAWAIIKIWAERDAETAVAQVRRDIDRTQDAAPPDEEPPDRPAPEGGPAG